MSNSDSSRSTEDASEKKQVDAHKTQGSKEKSRIGLNSSKGKRNQRSGESRKKRQRELKKSSSQNLDSFSKKPSALKTNAKKKSKDKPQLQVGDVIKIPRRFEAGILIEFESALPATLEVFR